MSARREIQLGGLVGPTHHYAGLAFGNVASETNEGLVSNPRAAALQSVEMMRMLLRLGQVVAIAPPLERPAVHHLHGLGFRGSDSEVLAAAAKSSPRLLSLISSAASMWTANAATCVPSSDSADARVQIVTANLISKTHRAFEAAETYVMLRRIFSDERHFAVHQPLPAAPNFSDEGAANHMRVFGRGDDQGAHIFVYGADRFNPEAPAPQRYPARQTKQASEAIALLAGLDNERSLFVQQSPTAIDAGVFHNDVIALSNEHLILAHEDAFVDPGAIEAFGKRRIGDDFQLYLVPRDQLSLEEVVRTYLFNGQLISLPGNRGMALILPEQCRSSAQVQSALEDLQGRVQSIREIHYVDLLESMRNGGGPACLRLRVGLSQRELGAMHHGVLASELLLERLEAWVRAHYRDRLEAADLADPDLLEETRRALDKLSLILELGSVYRFQTAGS